MLNDEPYVSQVWLNSGNGTFTDSGQGLFPGHDVLTLALGDIDKDGDLDGFVTMLDIPSRILFNLTKDPSDVTPDNDGDGIENAVDTQPDQASVDFTDGPVAFDGLTSSTAGGTTRGRIEDTGGNDVTISDASDPANGIHVSVAGSGTPAEVRFCELPPDPNSNLVTLAPGSDGEVTCGSLQATVFNGEFSVEAANGVRVDIPAGTTVLIEESGVEVIVTYVSGTEDVTVVLSDGSEQSVSPDDGPTAFGDEDQDGVGDPADACPGTASGDVIDAEGCSIAQICSCDAEWKNHGRYVSCVTKAADDFLARGLISEAQKDATVSAAARSSCAKAGK